MWNFHHTRSVDQRQTIAQTQLGDSVLAYSLGLDTSLRAVCREESCVAQLQSDPERTIFIPLQIADMSHATRLTRLGMGRSDSSN